MPGSRSGRRATAAASATSSAMSTGTLVVAVMAAVASLPTAVNAQYNQTHNLTPDGYWHNMYHALVSMASYGDYNYWCPTQTFTEASKLKNFPNSQRAPWTVVERWGPTKSGCEGFSVVVPVGQCEQEMNKVLMVFRGNHAYEQYLPDQVVGWGNLTDDLGKACPGCTVNAFAAQGYVEARRATNNFQKTRDAYNGQGLVFSITGHGLGGMHALIASVDYNQQGIAWYSHNYGTPRTFNPAGASWYNQRFNGEAGERGLFANDTYTEKIPSGPNYHHAGTAFYYWGNDPSTYGPRWNICWDDKDGEVAGCKPGAQKSTANTNSTQDHYFYWANVQQCGGDRYIEPDTVNKFLASNASGAYDAGVMSALMSGQSASILEIGGIHNASIRAAAAAAAASSASAASVAAASQSAAAVAANAAAAAASTDVKPNTASSLAISGMMGIGAAFLGLFVVL